MEKKNVFLLALAIFFPLTMSKRTLVEETSVPEAERRRVDGAQPMKEEDGMGEFEDPFEDEIESDGEIVQNEDDDMDEDEDEPEVQTKPFMPGTMQLEEGQTLVPDQSAYHMLHRMNVTWPCLSFDFLRDHLGSQRQSMPHTAFLVAGTQADTAKNNEVLVIKASSMHRTQHDDGTYDSSWLAVMS